MTGAEPPRVLPRAATDFDLTIETLIVGAGACGLTAALAATDSGQQVLVLEADAVPAGSTALSAGLIPAAGTRIQAAAGIDDMPDCFAADIQAKAKDENDPALVAALATGSGPAIDWLADRFGLPFSVVDDFDYPGHSRRRMHGLPTRAGAELIDRLRATCEDQGIDILCQRRVDTVFVDQGRITGIATTAPGGAREEIGCAKLILACNGYGGNRDLVRRHMPDIADALWFGHDGNQGAALGWAAGLSAATRHLGAYQGHGNVATPHGILITWAVITEGGVQINANGHRFWNEASGYSEAARPVLAQPGGTVWTVFDTRIAAIARQFADFRSAEAQGAIRQADTIPALAALCALPPDALQTSLTRPAFGTADRFGRCFDGPPLAAPYCAVRVTGALFHTQGGLATTPTGQVLRDDGTPIPNLYAAGGAACGVSGTNDSGYLSGNGLLSAIVMGRSAGLAPSSL